MIDLTGTLVARYRERFAELCRDADARVWGGLRREAALDVLGHGATPAMIDALLEAARADR